MQTDFKPGLRTAEHPLPAEGPPVWIILQGHMDRDHSLTYVQIDSCWPSAESARKEVEVILASKPKVIREQYSKSLRHPSKWEDATGNFVEIQKHEIRVPLSIHKEDE